MPTSATSGFNGAADFHPRKPRGPSRLARSGACFNGAADFHPRKLVHEMNTDPRARVDASMGPRTSIRGKLAWRCLCQLLVAGFNGAADFHPRKRSSQSPG